MKTCFALALSAGLALIALAEIPQTESFKLTGTVVDEAGQPVADALVEAYQANTWLPWHALEFELRQQTTTGSDGAYKFELPRVSTVVVARKPGLAPGWAYFGRPDAAHHTARLILTTPGKLAGVVIDESGRPAPDLEVYPARVMIEIRRGSSRAWLYSLEGQPARQCFSARTGPDGKFVIRDFPTNAVAVLSVDAPGKVLRPETHPLPRPDANLYRAGDHDIKLVLQPAAAIEGKVVAEPNGAPIAGALVQAQLPGQDFFLRSICPSALTGADGGFRIAPLLGGVYELHVSFETNAEPEFVVEPVRVTVVPGQTERDVRITAVRGALIEVTVFNGQNGKPATNAQVFIGKSVRMGPVTSDHWTTYTTDTNGFVRVRLIPGEYKVYAKTENRLISQRLNLLAAPDTTNCITLDLKRFPKFVGVVRCPDGTPACGLPVSCSELIPRVSRDVPITTDAAGQFEIEYDPEPVESLQQKLWVLVRDAERNMAAVYVFTNLAKPAELNLEPGVTITGKVVSEGRPVPNVSAAVRFRIEDTDVHLDGVNVRTTEPGVLEIPALPASVTYYIMSTAPGFGVKSVTVEATNAAQIRLDTIELKPARFIVAGRVLDLDNRPVANAHLTLWGPEQFWTSTDTDEQGRFTFTNVCEGKVNLYTTRDGLNAVAQTAAGDTNVVLFLDPRQIGFAHSEATSKILKGVVTDPDGKPADRAQVTVFPSWPTHWVNADTNGAFKFIWNISLGQRSTPLLMARHAERNLAALKEFNPDTPEVVIQLQPGVTITGRVEDQTGSPISYVEVMSELTAFGTQATFAENGPATDTQGRFTLGPLPRAGELVINVCPAGYSTARRKISLTNAASGLIELEPFVLKRADRQIAGQVLDQDGRPVPGARVHLRIGDTYMQTVTSDKTGRFAFTNVWDDEFHVEAQLFARGTVKAAAGDTNIMLRIQPQ